MTLTKNEATLRDLVIKIIHAGGADMPRGYTFNNKKKNEVGVPVKGNSAREVLISKLCRKGELHCTGVDVQEGLIFLAIGAGKSKPLPWESALLQTTEATGEEEEATRQDPSDRPSRARASSPVAERPCCCGCGGLARKAFVVTHDAKFSSMLGKLAKGVLSDEEAELVKKQAEIAWQNEHVSGSAYFQKKFKAAGLV